MEIRLSWNQITELVYRQWLELDGETTLTLDAPKGRLWHERPSDPAWQEPRLHNPEAEDARVVLKALHHRLADADTSNDFAPGEFATLRDVADLLEETLRSDDPRP